MDEYFVNLSLMKPMDKDFIKAIKKSNVFGEGGGMHVHPVSEIHPYPHDRKGRDSVTLKYHLHCCECDARFEMSEEAVSAMFERYHQWFHLMSGHPHDEGEGR